jgi:hypothetical protein
MPVQNPLSDADSDALLRLLTLVEGGVRAAPAAILARQLRDALAACGLLAGDAPLDAVGGALAQLQVRYRYSLGEYIERVTDGADQLDNR